MLNKHIKLTLLPLLILFFCFFLAPILVYADEKSDCEDDKGYWLKLPIFPSQIDKYGAEIDGRCIDNPVEYVVLAYEFGLGLLAVIAVLMIIWGGLRYLISRGNSSETSTAKDIITQAILGLILGLCSWLILYVINPQLVNLRWDTSALQSTLKTAADNLQKSLTEGEYEFCVNPSTKKSPMKVILYDTWYKVMGIAGDSEKPQDCEEIGKVLNDEVCKQAYIATTVVGTPKGCENYKKFIKNISTTIVDFANIMSQCGLYIDTSKKDSFNNKLCIGLPCKTTETTPKLGVIKDDPPNPNITGDTGGIRCVKD